MNDTWKEKAKELAGFNKIIGAENALLTAYILNNGEVLKFNAGGSFLVTGPGVVLITFIKKEDLDPSSDPCPCCWDCDLLMARMTNDIDGRSAYQCPRCKLIMVPGPTR